MNRPRSSVDASAADVQTWPMLRPPAVGQWDVSLRTASADAFEEQTCRYREDLRIDPPRAVSVAIRKPKIKTLSLMFPEGAQVPAFLKSATETRKAAPPSSPSPSGPRNYTRLKPPKDIVKLEDRLFYVLQPPLESWVRTGEITFPFRPFPYQFEGIAFLYPRQAALLADEMGLGKTMQTISAIRLLLRAGQISSVLLICPKPLVTNWQREFAMWAPEIPLLTIQGDQTRRRWQWSLADMPVKVANYELLIRDREVLEEPDRKFDLVVLDEAQRIKNTSNSTAQVVRSIDRRRSWALSGTPVENRSDDLIGIFEFLAPGYLCPSMKLTHLGKLASDYVLRRTKQNVLKDLPPKLIRDVELDLTASQWDSYRLAEDKGVVKLTEMGDHLTIQHVFELVLRLKQVCNFDPVTGESAKLDRLAAELEEIADSGEKALVFSQWVDTLTELGKRLKRFGPLEYHGRIPSSQRDGIIDQFKNDPDKSVLLMSYGAGGVGLNLQFATYVFLFDRWWNPAVEDQAINRAHRIGAAGPVTVTRFIAAGTIEQRIDQILQEKREIFDTIFSGAKGQRTGLSKAEVFSLFQLRDSQGKIEVPK